MRHKFVLFSLTALAILGISSCSVTKKAKMLAAGEVDPATISALTDVRYYTADTVMPRSVKDELRITEEDLRAIAEYDTLQTGELIMHNVKDEVTGEEILVDRLKPSIIISRFVQRQERGGNVPIDFLIRVPATMVDQNWQVRLNPELRLVNSHVNEGVYELLGEESLEPVLITGRYAYRIKEREQKKFDKLAERLSDTLSLTDWTRLRIFKERNFNSFDHTDDEAFQHYTDTILRNRNKYRLDHIDKEYDRIMCYPDPENGAMLDTLVNSGDEFVYQYSVNVPTKGRPTLNKALVYLSGEINHNGDIVYNIPQTDSLEYPISTVIDFVKDTVMYKIIEVPTHLDASEEYNLLFAVRSTEFNPNLGDNANQLNQIRGKVRELMSDDKYLLDSIVVTASASPEGSWSLNRSLSQGRASSVSHVINPYVSHLRDSVARAMRKAIEAEGTTLTVEVEYDANGNLVEKEGEEIKQVVKVPQISFISNSVPEYWTKLADLINVSSEFSAKEKDQFFKRMRVSDPDRRENLMKNDSYYARMKSNLYPQLRVVRFDFKLHLKETVNRRIVTDEIDEIYKAGLDALKDRNWEEGIRILRNDYPEDYNLGVAYLMMDRNENARLILERQSPSPEIDYMLAIVYMRLGMEKKALQTFIDSYTADQSKFWRGNRDPEIRYLINKYQLKYNTTGTEEVAAE